jgi:putative mRNA 3-end processing factor
MAEPTLLILTDSGLYCPAGDFFIDPWRPVDRAVLTHGHADHATPGSRRYLAAREGAGVLRVRLGPDAAIEAADYGREVALGRVRVSLHPAGHILGSAQVRVEHRGEVWVVSGDYKREPDPTCTPFEPVRCHTFVTESTFGLPVYRWPSRESTFAEVDAWWRANREAGRACLLFGYALGKAQRLLAGLDPAVGPIYTHGAVETLVRAYREAGVALPPTSYVGSRPAGTAWAGSMIVAPPSAHGTPWARRFGPASTAMASGWMRIRGARRRRAFDRGFVLSDHADWPGLLDAIEATGARHVWVTHGYAAALARWLEGRGLDARVVPTRYEGERNEGDVAGEDPAPEEPE